MKLVQVTFPNSEKRYTYKTNLNLIKGGVYEITADGNHTYTSPVTVREIKNDNFSTQEVIFERYGCREITHATCVKAPPRREPIKQVYFNEAKGATTVIWSDDSVTVCKCVAGDKFDKEKGLAMCFMKRSYQNRSISKVLQKYCEEE